MGVEGEPQFRSKPHGRGGSKAGPHLPVCKVPVSGTSVLEGDAVAQRTACIQIRDLGTPWGPGEVDGRVK